MVRRVAEVRVPVRPMTRFIAAFLVGALGGPLLASLALPISRAVGLPPGIELSLVCGCMVVTSLRGAMLRLVVRDGSVTTRNLFSTRTIDVDRIDGLGMLRTAGALKGDTPALILSNRRLRLPLYPATMLGAVWSSRSTDGDREIARRLVRWADGRNITVESHLRSVADGEF